MTREPAWKRHRSLAAVVFLFALNAWITLPLFFTDYTRQMGSIEAAYVGLARYLSRHMGLHWFPLWYGGIPYPDTYPPLLHAICGLVVATTHCSPGLAHHFVTATLFALTPVALYWMVSRISGNRGAAFAAALGYSLISPACLLVREVRFDAGGAFAARRLHTLVIYGEGPHLTSLCLLPVALGMLYLALTRRRLHYYFATAIAMALVPLSNWLGAIALAFGAAALVLAFADRISSWLLAAVLGVWAYAIALPWMSPSTIATIQANAPRVANNFQATTGQRIFLLSVMLGLLAAAWLLRRYAIQPATRFALLFSYLTGATALCKYWFKLELVPQPERYHLEMDMAFWIAAALLLYPLLNRDRVRNFVLCTGSAAVVALAISQHRTAREWEQPIDITSTIEYRSARWLDEHMPTARVFAPGTIGFWLNAFTDNPQITGGFDNGIVNPLLPHVIFQVYAGDKQQITADLMGAFGVDAVIAGGKDSREFYHPISHAEKFTGLTELWRDGPDAIYHIPRRTRSLAHAMLPASLVQTTPVAYDTTAIQPYLAALNDAAMPPVALQWTSPDHAVVTAEAMRPEQILSVQVTWTKGWSAWIEGRAVEAHGDKLGQMVVEPHCSGACKVDLYYDGGSEHAAAVMIHGAALLLGIGTLLWAMGRRYVQSFRIQR